MSVHSSGMYLFSFNKFSIIVAKVEFDLMRSEYDCFQLGIAATSDKTHVQSNNGIPRCWYIALPTNILKHSAIQSIKNSAMNLTDYRLV